MTMEFRNDTANHQWTAFQRSCSIASIRKEYSSHLTFITVTGGMLPLSTLELLAEGARMISDNPAIGTFTLNYAKVAAKNKLMQLVKDGSEDRLIGFIEGIRSVR